MEPRIADDELLDHIAALPPKEAGKWLLLEEHPEFPGHWEVNSLGSAFRFDLAETIGRSRVVSPAGLEAFLADCNEHAYQLAFGEDPTRILEAYAHLNDAPEVALNSELPGTINGLLPFQVRGFNALKGKEGAAAVMSTGTGKSVVQAALVKYHYEREHFDICWVVAKGHNKVNAQRSLWKFAGLPSFLLAGTRTQREGIYEEILDARLAGEKGIIVVTNYEKFRDDFCEIIVKENRAGEKMVRAHLREEFYPFFVDLDSMYCWDEMPTKLKNRTSRLYLSVCNCLYDTPAPKVTWEKRRANALRQIMFSATPIEIDPGDWFNTERLLNGGRTYGTVTAFQNRYVKRYDHFDRTKPAVWHRLDEMALQGASVMFIADKENDPEIAAQFPQVVPREVVIDWDDAHRAVYDRVYDLAEELIERDEQPGILATLSVLQMLCCSTAMVGRSAAIREAYETALEAFSDEEGGEGQEPTRRGSALAVELLRALEGSLPSDELHTKYRQLREDLTSRYRSDKVVVFTTYNNALLPIMEKWLDTWGVTYVTYRGQEDEDAFREDPDIQVFLSSDRGSDSINLESASKLINFNPHPNFSRMKQRDNRIHRVTSTFQSVEHSYYKMADSVELRLYDLVERKRGYHEALYQKGLPSQEATSAGMTKEDLLYVLGR